MRGGGNMQQMMKQMQKMQKKMAQEQEKLKEEAVDPEDIEMLQDLVLAATNEAMNKADELTQQRLGKHTQGLNIPGM